jgi:NADH:ubiquinone oxidoreductase subunit 2 (subunit N)
MLVSSSLISFWLSLECQSFSLILLIFYDNNEKITNIESLIKYFIVSAISGIILLLGISQLYGGFILLGNFNLNS